MAGMVWTFDVMEDLINLRNEYREEFENALNTEHAAIWDGIATEINNHYPATSYWQTMPSKMGCA
ncbi:17891_t:CDS:1, partial [Funneliformis geosporum]